MTSVHDVAAAIVDATGPVTSMKLEKLIYYCQAWHLARHGVDLFPEEIEAWAQGPVVRDLYLAHKGAYSVSSWPLGDPLRLTQTEHETISWVLHKYGPISAERLSRMTHAEAPWRAARGVLDEGERSSAPISRRLMGAYYARQAADIESAVVFAASNAALEGGELDGPWLDRLRDVAAGRLSADSLVAEEIARLQT